MYELFPGGEAQSIYQYAKGICALQTILWLWKDREKENLKPMPKFLTRQTGSVACIMEGDISGGRNITAKIWT